MTNKETGLAGLLSVLVFVFLMSFMSCVTNIVDVSYTTQGVYTSNCAVRCSPNDVDFFLMGFCDCATPEDTEETEE